MKLFDFYNTIVYVMFEVRFFYGMWHWTAKFAHTETTCAQVDRLEDELVGEQDKFKAITEELDQTFAEMSGY